MGWLPPAAVLPLPPPELPPLIRAATMDSLLQAMASVPADLRDRNDRHIVLLRGQRRLLLLENGSLRTAFPVAVGMPGWETPTGTFKVLEKIPNPIWVHPVTGQRVEEQDAENPLGSHWIAFHTRTAWGVMPMTGRAGSRSRAAPPRGFTAPLTAGRWAVKSPMDASASTTKTFNRSIGRCRWECR